MKAPNLEAAYHYRNIGLSVIPLEAGSKKPVSGYSWKSFQEKPITPGRLESFFDENPERNIGVIGGTISGNLAILDIDDMTRFRMKGGEDRIREIIGKTWTVRSARKGLHIYLRTPEPLKSGPRKEWGIDIKAEGGYVVAPKSVYRGAGQYEFLNHPEHIIELPSLDEIAFLKPDIANREKEIRPYGIPFKFWEILRFGAFHKYGYGEHGSKGGRSGFDAHFLAYIIEDGWIWEEILSLYETSAHTTNRFNARDKTSGYAYLRSQYEKALEYVKANRSEIKQSIRAAETFLQTLEVPGRTGLTDLSVLRALLRISYRTNKIEIQASIREVLQLSGISDHNTLRRALSRITQTGFIQKTKTHTTHYATTYNIEPLLELVSKSTHTYTTHTVKEWGDFDTLDKHKISSGLDVFRFKGLGKTGEEVFRRILEKPGMTSGEIIQLSRVGRRTVYRKLDMMDRVGMIESRENRWFPLQFDFEEVARSLGTAGALEKQRARHEKEREAHRMILEDLAVSRYGVD